MPLSVPTADSPSQRLEVRLWSHLRFSGETEPESDKEILTLANTFAEPFGEFLKGQTDGTAALFVTLEARRTSSGVVELAFFITYFSLQAALGAPALFQLISPSVERFAQQQWVQAGNRAGRKVVASENRFWVVEDRHWQVTERRAVFGNGDTAGLNDRGDVGGARGAQAWTRDVSMALTGFGVAILAIGAFWLAFGREDNRHDEYEQFEVRLEALERRAAAPDVSPSISNTIHVEADSRAGAPVEQRRRVRCYSSRHDGCQR